TTDADIYIYSMADQQMKRISQHTGEATYTPQAFDPQGRYLYYTTNDGSEFTYLARYQLSNGKKGNVENSAGDIMFTRFSRNGKYRVVGINEDARTRIKVYEESTGKPIDLPIMPNGEITSVRIARSEKQMAFYFNGDRSPSNLYVCDISSKQSKKLTSSLNTETDTADLVDAQIIRYKSFDGLEIPAILYKPLQATTDNKVPALVWVHGGPGGQTRIGYSDLIQFFVNHGYVVLGVNNRG